MTIQDALLRLKNRSDNREFVCIVTAENKQVAKTSRYRFFSLRVFYVDEMFQCVYPSFYPVLSTFKTASIADMCEFLSTRFEQRFRALNSDISSTHAALDLKISVITRQIANHPLDDAARRFIAMPNTISNSIQSLVADYSRVTAKTAMRMIDHLRRVARQSPRHYAIQSFSLRRRAVRK